MNLKLSTYAPHCALGVLDLTCTHFDYAEHEEPVANLLDMLQVRFDYRTLVKDQTDVGFNIYTLRSY